MQGSSPENKGNRGPRDESALHTSRSQAPSKNPVQRKGLGWVFRSLWSHCGPGSKDSILELTIPDTIVFDKGEPKKWLRTATSGKVIRANFMRNGRPIGRKRTGFLVDENTVRERMAAIIETFENFQQEKVKGVSAKKSGGPPTICVAWYTDGGKELLSSEMLGMLSKHRAWRSQLTALQAYVPPARVAIHDYDSETLAGKTQEGMALVDANTTPNTADQTLSEDEEFTKKLEKCTRDIVAAVEKSYGGESLPSDSSSDTDKPSGPKGSDEDWWLSFLKVVKLEAQFILDDDGTLWFSHPNHTHVQLRDQREMDSLRQEEERKRDEALAQTAKKELRLLLSAANRRGLPPETSYAHFDTLGVGYVDPDMLRLGLNRLGIRVTTVAAFILVNEINPGKNQFCLKDLMKWAHLGKLDPKYLAQQARRGAQQALEYDDEQPCSPLRMPAQMFLPSFTGARLRSRGSRRPRSQQSQKGLKTSLSMGSSFGEGSVNSLQEVLVEGFSTENVDPDDPDQIVFLETGLVMTYRILEPPKRDNTGELKDYPYTLLAVPGVLMTLDSLEIVLKPLVDVRGAGRIILVGLPGLPNTLWPEDTLLNADFYCECLTQFAERFLEKDENIVGTPEAPPPPLLLMAFGSGCTALLEFCNRQLPKLPKLSAAAKVLVFANGIFSSEDQELRQTVLALRQVLESSDPAERSQALISLLLSETFRRKIGEKEATAEFWETRKGLALRTQGTANEGDGKQGLNAILNMLDGILEPSITRQSVDNIAHPILLIQGTEDCFVPTNQPQCLRELLGYNIDIVSRPSDLMVQEDDKEDTDQDTTAPESARVGQGAGKPQVLHAAWLKSGHEVLQERGPYVLAVISSLINVHYGIHPGATRGQGEEDESKRDDVLSSSDGQSEETDQVNFLDENLLSTPAQRSSQQSSHLELEGMRARRRTRSSVIRERLKNREHLARRLAMMNDIFEPINMTDADNALIGAQIRQHLEDVYHWRYIAVEMMKWRAVLQDRLAAVKAKYDSTKIKIRRAAKTLARVRRGSVTLMEFNPQTGEMLRMQRELEKNRAKLVGYEGQMLKIQGGLSGVERNAESGLNRLKEQEEATGTVLKKMEGLLDRMREYCGVLRVQRHHWHYKESRCKAAIEHSTNRIEDLNGLISKFSEMHKNDFVDTDVWQTGLLQRVRIKDLRKHLKRELKQNEKYLECQKTELKLHEQSLVDNEVNSDKLFFSLDRIGVMLDHAKDALPSTDIETDFKVQVAAEKQAVEAKDAGALVITEHNSMADKIRFKPSKDKTKEEKLWTGLDVLINPDAYSHITELEAEEMKYDKDYHMGLSRQDVLRLLALPPQINLALPFLLSPDEVEAHRLLSRYTLEQDGAVYKNQDAASQDQMINKKESIPSSEGTLKINHRDVPISDLLKQHTATQVRATKVYQMNDPEKLFIALDRVLTPDLYMDYPVDENWQGAPQEVGILAELDKAALLELVSDDDIGSMTHNEFDAQVVLKELYVPEVKSLIGRKAESSLAALRNDVKALMIQHDGDDLESRSSSVPSLPLLPPVEPILPVPTKRDRLWGSWDSIHPASCGIGSQEDMFDAMIYNPRACHPASYAAWCDYNPFEAEGVGDPGSIILLNPAAANWLQNRGRATIVVHSIKELCLLDKAEAKKRGVVIASGASKVIFEDPEILLSEGQSRALDFAVEEYTEGIVLEFTVSIIFRGHFDSEGNYHLGRLAGSLFRLPPESSEEGDPLGYYTEQVPPVSIGYSSHGLQSLNTPTSLGRLLIHHQPRAIPVRPGHFRIIVGAASNCRYSVTVTARLAEDALLVVNRTYEEAKQKHTRLHQCILDIQNAGITLRLTERKVKVCLMLLREAKAELRRNQRDIDRYKEHLKEDNIRMFLQEEQRDELTSEIQALEEEFNQWAHIHQTRFQEVVDVRSGLKDLETKVQNLSDEKEKLKEELEELRRSLPAAYHLLKGPKEAAAVSFELNSSLDPFSNGKWVSAEERKKKLVDVLTPADEVRFKYRYEGWEEMTEEERKFLVMDKKMNPKMYTWDLEENTPVHIPMRLRGHRKRAYQQADDPKKKGRRTNINLAAPQQIPKPVKRQGYVEGFDMTKEDILRIQVTPFDALERKELEIRKILNKYHEDPARALLQKQDEKILELAPKVRQKAPSHWTVEELEWVSIDKILYPEIWQYLDRASRINATGLARDARRKSFMRKLKTGKLPNQGEDSDDDEELDLASWTKKKTDYWECPFKREEVIKIWKTENISRLDVEEKKTHSLLMKYRGKYNQGALDEQTVQDKGRLLALTGFKVGSSNFGADMEDTDLFDIDNRCRVLLREHDRIKSSQNEFSDSFVLHISPQRFPTKILCLDLLQEIDRLLQEQVFEREKALKYTPKQTEGGYGSWDEDFNDEPSGEVNGNGVSKGKKTSKEKNGQRPALAFKNNDKNKRSKKGAKDEEEKTVRFEGDANDRLKQLMSHIDEQKKKADKERLAAKCSACGDKACEWMASVNEEAIRARRAELGAEIQRVRRTKLAVEIFESDIPLSALRGGRSGFRREELLSELVWEDRELERQLELNNLDRELHNVHASNQHFVQIKEIHKYPQLMWKTEALQVLTRERERFIAWTVSVEIVDDLLEGMLEGWAFGVRDSNYPVAGYVPSLKKKGFIRAGAEQRRMMAVMDEKIEKREHKREDNEELLTMKEKEEPIEAASQQRLKEEHEKKKQDEYVHLLNETEHSMKYGMFLHALNYFKSMTLVQREKHSWQGKYDAGLGPELDPYRSKTHLTKERKKMIEEDRNRTNRQMALRRAMTLARIGEERQRARLEAERMAIRRAKYLASMRRRAEHQAAVVLQKAYRGHVGRVQAKYWALKRAELEAMKVLIQESAIDIQRCWRGYMARKKAAEAKIELAEFIAMIRAEELAADEVEYWQQNKLERSAVNAKIFLAQSIAKDKPPGT